MSAKVVGRALVTATADLPPKVRDKILARIGESIGEAARAAVREAPSSETRARWAAAARLPVPTGLRTIHASWIEASLYDLPARAREAVVGQGGDRAAIWLARRACAGWATVANPDDLLAGKSVVTARTETMNRAIARDANALVMWLRTIGADQIAEAARIAGVELLAALARRYPDLALAAGRIARPPRAGKLGPPRAVVERCRELLAGELADEKLVLLGARCLAPYLDAFERRAFVMRLPRTQGIAIEAMFDAYRDAPLDKAPAWMAIAP